LTVGVVVLLLRARRRTVHGLEEAPPRQCHHAECAVSAVVLVQYLAADAVAALLRGRVPNNGNEILRV